MKVVPGVFGRRNSSAFKEFVGALESVLKLSELAEHPIFFGKVFVGVARPVVTVALLTPIVGLIGEVVCMSRNPETVREFIVSAHFHSMGFDSRLFFWS
jgi:hypothetical protein